MTRIEILGRHHPLRSAADAFIRKTYALRYGAVIPNFPDRILSLLTDDDRVLCAAGVRDHGEGFFSERYLDASIEGVLRERTGCDVARGQIFEVSTLASQTPCSSAAFVRQIIAYGEARGFAWSFFTATGRLQTLLGRIGIPSIDLAAALPDRIAEAKLWGRYYETHPRVWAVPGSRAALGTLRADRSLSFDAAAA